MFVGRGWPVAVVAAVVAVVVVGTRLQSAGFLPCPVDMYKREIIQQYNKMPREEPSHRLEWTGSLETVDARRAGRTSSRVY